MLLQSHLNLPLDCYHIYLVTSYVMQVVLTQDMPYIHYMSSIFVSLSLTLRSRILSRSCTPFKQRFLNTGTSTLPLCERYPYLQANEVTEGIYWMFTTPLCSCPCSLQHSEK